MSPGPVGLPLGVWGGGRCTMYLSMRFFYLHYFPRVSTPSVPTCRAARLADRWNTLRRPMEHASSGSFWRENRVFRSEPRVGGKYSIFPWCCVSVGCVLYDSFFPRFLPPKQAFFALFSPCLLCAVCASRYEILTMLSSRRISPCLFNNVRARESPRAPIIPLPIRFGGLWPSVLWLSEEFF